MENKENKLSSRRQELFEKKASRTAASYLRRLKEIKGMSDEMLPFFERLSHVHVSFGGVSDKPTVGTFCIMAPNELIYAAGAMPVRLCSGNYAAYTLGDDDVPRDACPLVKAVEGAVAAKNIPVYEDCDLFVIPITCDCKKKIAGLIRKEKPTHVMHLPAMKTEDAYMEQYVRELYRLKENLEELTGNEITAESLSESIAKTGYAQYEMSRFLEIKRKYPLLTAGTHSMAIMNSYAYMDAGEWAKHLSSLNDELKDRAERGIFAARENQPRILVTGSPIVFPNLKIPLLIEETGGILAADETCMGDRSLSDPIVVLDDSLHGMLQAIARRYTRPCTCPVFADNRQRIFRILQMIKDYRVDGVIYHVLRGCLVYDYEYQMIEEELEKQGIPVIRVESDYNEEDVEQIRIRIEAFIELIKLAKIKAGKGSVKK